jgi:type II secretion system protein N
MDEILNSMENPNESMESSQGTEPQSALTNDASSPSRLKRILKLMGWFWLGMSCLILFTLLKLPEDRIRNFVQGEIASQLSAQGITMNASQSSISIGFGISYTLKDITLSFPPPQESIHIDQMSISPSLLSAILGKLGATIRVENKGGAMHASFSVPMRGPNGPVSLSFNCSNLDLGSLGVLPATAGIKGSALANGEGTVDGDTSLPTTLNGKIKLDFSKIVIDQQSVLGFSVPRLTVSEGKADIDIDKGKALIKTLRLGKPGNTADDLKANLTGDVVIGKNLPYSTLNLKADFSFSQTVLKAFVLLDAILGPAKMPDGSYSYTLTGPLNAPNATPMGTGGAPAAPTPPSAPQPEGANPGAGQ